MISSGLSITVVLYRHGQLSAAVTQTFAFRIKTFIVIKTASQNSPSCLKGNPISRWFIGFGYFVDDGLFFKNYLCNSAVWPGQYPLQKRKIPSGAILN